MPSDGREQPLEEASGSDSGPNPDPDTAPKPDPATGQETHHVIDVVAEEKDAVVEEEKVSTAAAAAEKKGSLSRSDSGHEQCRCRGELSVVHRSCIEIWFRTKGSNKCEICQQVATNVPSLDSQPSANHWVWRVDSAYRGTAGRANRARYCFSPLWVAFAILIGGLLLDVLISVSLGVSALPVNIIIGVLVVLGLGTAFRLALECCHEFGSTRNVERIEVSIHHGSRPVV